MIMFYEDNHDNALRFGDVVKGYVLSNTKLQSPIYESDFKYNIDIELPFFSVILTPCCSISDKIITLSPLIKLRPSIFDNSVFENDLTCINRPMSPQDSVPLDVWNQFTPEEKQKRLLEGEGYAFKELFVYERNKLFPVYKLKRKQRNIETNYYMIDFKNVYKVNCDRIIDPKNSPLDSKHLQLSIKTRSELRNKVSNYYSRIPIEDRV